MKTSLLPRRSVTLGGLLLAALTTGPAQAQTYDPLAADTNALAAPLDRTVHEPDRDRDIPVRVYLPVTTNPAPVVLFSHGLGGTREGSPFLGRHWAARGYVAVFIQHPGSDDSVWKGKRPGEAMAEMKAAASLDNFFLRVRDVPSVLNQLEHWDSQSGDALAGRMNLQKVGMSGHSFGAVTTEAVSGETLPLSGRNLTDARITAAIAFSPSPPSTGSAARAFDHVSIPWMLMTGTKDVAPIGHVDVLARRSVYQNLKGATKYELVLFNAEHSVFTDTALPGEHEPRNPNHHRVILALSTAFWDAYLNQNSAALAWLQGKDARSVLEPADEWQWANP